MPHPSGQRVAAQAEIRGPERNILRDGRHEQLVVGILKHQADAPADVVKGLAAHRDSADVHRTAGGHQHAVEMQHQRGLAGAVWSEHRDPFTGRDGQVDAVEGDLAVRIDVAHGLHTNRGHCITHASTDTVTAAAAGIIESTHCAAAARGGAPTTARSGALPSKPRDSIAWYTRSPRS